MAGEILQKFINYHVKIAIYGDYSVYTSKPLRDFIYESNHGKDVFVGDDVWIGQGASLLKGATIGSGSVLGYGSILTKQLESNTICSGAPAKVVKRNIIWDRQSMHNFSMNSKAKFEEQFEFEKKIVLVLTLSESY